MMVLSHSSFYAAQTALVNAEKHVGLAICCKKNFDDMYNCFDTVAAAHGQTDRNPISISRAGMNVKILSSSKLSIVNIIRTLRNGSVCRYVG